MRNREAYEALADAELVQQYQREGNQQWLAVLYQRYADLLFGLCLKYLKDPEEAADACADIYTQLVDKLRKHQVEYFKGWLHVVARNHCLQVLRQAKKMPQTSLADGFVQSEDGLHLEEVMQKEMHLDALQYCIEHLNSEQKEAVGLFYLQEKSYEEIAVITGEPWNTVRSHIQNGRRNLKNCMEKTKQQHV